MTHFAILCPTGTGHMNPMTTLGYELLRRGHRVTLIGPLDAKSKSIAVGLEFHPYGENNFPAGSTPRILAELGCLSGFAALRYTINIFKKVTTTLLQEVPVVIQEIGADVLLVDQASFGGGTVAQALGMPFISVCCALMLNRELDVPPINTAWTYQPTSWTRLRNTVSYQLILYLTNPILKIINDFRIQRNLPILREIEDEYSQWAQICQQPPEFEFPRQSLPPCFHFTGPYTHPDARPVAPFPFEKLTGQPLIYASLGTVQNRLLGVFQTIAAACQDLDAQLVIALGGGSTIEALPPLPGNPLVVGYAPQLQLLQQSQLTITHAGMNTTLESLSQGVPMVAIPIANDQPGVAARIAWTGTGEMLSLKGLTVSQLRHAIQRVLWEDAYRQKAIQFKENIQRAGGLRRAVDIIEQVAATGKPVVST